jgi:hypothetical protein
MSGEIVSAAIVKLREGVKVYGTVDAIRSTVEGPDGQVYIKAQIFSQDDDREETFVVDGNGVQRYYPPQPSREE